MAVCQDGDAAAPAAGVGGTVRHGAADVAQLGRDRLLADVQTLGVVRQHRCAHSQATFTSELNSSARIQV